VSGQAASQADRFIAGARLLASDRLAITEWQGIMTVTVATLGFPRIGPRRELKTALERYWSGKSDRAALLGEAADLRAKTWARQQALGVDHIPSNDFSLYDHVLDTSAMLGAIPEVYGWSGGPVDLDTYFAMARGAQEITPEGEADHAGCGHGHRHAIDVPAAEMTKWFDTNYHYLAPEVSPGRR
jgi:5-methyltetrahydropteroyltriglutamate--homocysteine methyltransferase